MKQQKTTTQKNQIILSNDWHFGNANNDPRHNENLLEFIQWMIHYAKRKKIKQFAFGGDFFHQRDKINVHTMNYALTGVIMLHAYFGKFPMVIGNHDLYYKDSRDITSLQIFEPYADLIDFYEIDKKNSIMYVSWLNTQKEYDEVIKASAAANVRFMYGHFEFTKFMMNDHYKMEHGYSHKELAHMEKVFSGHYHMRQNKGNVYYTGNPFPFDFNDTNDMQRGFVVLDLDTGEHEYVDYDKIRVESIDYKDFLQDDFAISIDENKQSLKVIVNEEIENEVLDAIKEKLERYNLREAKVEYKSTKLKEVLESEVTIEEVSSVDEAVIKFLKGMEPIEGIDKDTLIKIYETSKDNNANT